MEVQIKDSNGKVVRRSKNLRGILDNHRVRRTYVAGVIIQPELKGATLHVVWDNNDHASANFASLQVLIDWCKQRTKTLGWPEPVYR